MNIVRRSSVAVTFLGGMLLSLTPTLVNALSGTQVYEKTCALCHAAGVAGAPRLGFSADWQTRIAAGKSKLYTSALNGTAAGMPMKGGNLALSDVEVRAAVDFLLASVSASEAASTTTKSVVPNKNAREKVSVATSKQSATSLAPSKSPALATTTSAASTQAPASSTTTPDVQPAAAATAVETKPAPDGTANPNAFNRLLAAPGARNPPPALDGIHDPENFGTGQLQHPSLAFSQLPKSNTGNRVNWVKSLEIAKVQPRWDKDNASAAAVVMDLNIVREVKGSMPDVVYPHKQHTEWLDCAACHPQIFIPQKGANQISMAAIMLGQKCGVCHGKVAFPVSECRLCHSKPKEAVNAAQERGVK